MFLINIKFHLDHSRLGYLTGLLSSKLPSKFTIRVSRLTQAGYKVREVLEHRRDQRTTRTYYGLHFKLSLTGKARRFSWSKLLSEIVLKFGLLGVITTILDLLWQIVFPWLGYPDYNNLVFKSVAPAVER